MHMNLCVDPCPNSLQCLGFRHPPPQSEVLVKILLGKEEVISKVVSLPQLHIYDPDRNRTLTSRSNILIFLLGNLMYYCDLIEYSVTLPGSGH